MDKREVVCSEVCLDCWEELEVCQCGIFMDEFYGSRDYELDPCPPELPFDPLLGDEPVKHKRKRHRGPVV